MDGSGDCQPKDINQQKVYYSIKCPTNTDILHVYDDVIEASLILKKCEKSSRMKKFTCVDEAREFATEIDINIPVISSEKKPVKKVEQLKPGRMLVAVRTENLQSIKDIAAENKRYLVTTGGSPAILQVGFRYNAIHVAAFNGKLKSAILIMQLINNPALFNEESQNGEGQVSPENVAQAIEILTDLYINSPEKGNSEVPLHFACKFGHADVVQYLLSIHLINVEAINDDKKTPEEIVCSRKGDNETKTRILRMFKERYYVPLIRSLDNSEVPEVGMVTKNVQHHVCPETLNYSIQTPSKSSNLSGLFASPRGCHAVAGPMEVSAADTFRTTWKTLKEIGEKIPNKVLRNIQRSDFEKGLERVGREFARNKGLKWTEHWDFMNMFADFGTEEGLVFLESHLYKRAIEEVKIANISAKILKDLKDSPMIEDSSSDDNDSEYGSINSSFSSIYETASEDESSDPLNQTPIFIIGNTPSKKDLDVLRAINLSLVSPATHPNINKWRNLITSFSVETRENWKTPRATKSQSEKISRQRITSDNSSVVRKLYLDDDLDDESESDNSSSNIDYAIRNSRQYLNFE